MVLLRIAILLAASLLLSGCLTSSRPLFEAKTEVAAFGNGGRYQTYEATASGYKRDEIVTLRRTADGYDFVNEKGAANALTVHRLADGRLMGQVRDDGGRYNYFAVQVRGATILTRAASCARQDHARLAALGVEVRDSECVLDRVKDPNVLFAAIKFEEKPAKMVRLRRTARTRR